MRTYRATAGKQIVVSETCAIPGQTCDSSSNPDAMLGGRASQLAGSSVKMFLAGMIGSVACRRIGPHSEAKISPKPQGVQSGAIVSSVAAASGRIDTVGYDRVMLTDTRLTDCGTLNQARSSIVILETAQHSSGESNSYTSHPRGS